MKLFLSYSEAARAVRSSMGLREDVEIVIGRKQDEKKSTGNLDPLPDNLRALVKFIDANEATNKIACIQEYRTFTGLGLREAKDSIENWSKVRAFVAEKNFFPNISYNNGIVTFY